MDALKCSFVIIHLPRSTWLSTMVFHTFIVTSSVIMKPLGLHNLQYDVVTTCNHSGGNVRVLTWCRNGEINVQQRTMAMAPIVRDDSDDRGTSGGNSSNNREGSDGGNGGSSDRENTGQ